MWCVRHGVTLIPCWVPRSSKLIQEADRLSRVRDVYGLRTPAAVFDLADELAVDTWGTRISFDRMASHLNAMPPSRSAPRLPFNSRWMQPGSAGVDMFLQPLHSWRAHVNFIHPPEPMVARVLTFIPRTMSRAVVAFPTSFRGHQWWSNWASPAGPGVVHCVHKDGFLVLVIDHTPRSSLAYASYHAFIFACSHAHIAHALDRVTCIARV